MNEITSAQNPKYRKWLSLLESKGLKKERRCLVSGEKLVREFVHSWPSLVEEILLPAKGKFDFGETHATKLSAPLFKELDVIGTHQPLLVAKTPEIKEWDKKSPQGLEVVVSLSDPSNLGALLRSAEAMNVNRVILTKECASPYLPRALKAASLSTFRLNMCVTDSVRELQLNQAFGLDMKGENIASFVWPRDALIVLGEEGQGLPPALKLRRLKIDMNPKTESLNATVAASLAMYSYRLRWPISG
jgi:TrmH family RNA methyltransferase